jgi:hypothetical protein
MITHRLLKYSTSALTFIALKSNANAQAVYVDIDPDTTLLPPYESYLLDIDDVGFVDYKFTVIDATVYSDWCECYVHIMNAILGGIGSRVAFTTYQFTSNQYLISALTNGANIREDLNFTQISGQLAYRIIPDFSFYYAFEGGDWFPEAIDKYVGIRFTDSLDCMHYGWIRCSVEDNGTKLTIKDYAYETKCDVGIVAGDMIGDTSVAINALNNLNAHVYSFEKTLHIQTGSAETYTVTISNVSGQQLFKNTISGLYTKIDLQLFAPGIYVVSLISGDFHYVKKVVIG